MNHKNHPWNTLGLCQGDLTDDQSDKMPEEHKTTMKSECPKCGLTITSNIPPELRCGYQIK